MSDIGTEDGAGCNRDGCERVLVYKEVKGCCCHINPPCSACVKNPLVCDQCEWSENDE